MVFFEIGYWKRTLEQFDPTRRYRAGYHDRNIRQLFHIGQRKLLMSEIEFLTFCAVEKREQRISKKTVVIYAGAAAGMHFPSLMHLFQDILFVLVDPNEFDLKGNYDASKVIMINDFFTDEMATRFAREYANYDILFVSDIRSTSPDDPDNEARVKQDMDAQARWHHILNARKSMLKFRLPYTKPEDDPRIESTYLDGVIQLPIWGPVSTTECRLIVNRGCGTKRYNNKTIENQMFYFNSIVRYERQQWPRGSDMLQRIYQNFYDDISEIFVIGMYFKLVCGITRDREIYQNVLKYSDHINVLIQRPRRRQYVPPDYSDSLMHVNNVDESFANRLNRLAKRMPHIYELLDLYIKQEDQNGNYDICSALQDSKDLLMSLEDVLHSK